MTLKFQFEPNQEHQTQAISALVDVFRGQQQRAVNMAPVLAGEEVGALPGLEISENGIGNWLYLTEEQLRKNVREIQARNGIADAGSSDSLHSWLVRDPLVEESRDCYQFTIEMETGTGKTYVFLRSIMELAEKYGYRKFVIVVPSVAIREGALKSLEQLKDHLSTLYKTPMDYFVYDSKNVSRLREFALSDSVQIMVINIQAFVKAINEEGDVAKGGKVIYKPSDALSGRRPIDFVHAARPVVIIDEPQSVDGTEKAKESIMELNPLFIVRYSATHRERYDLLYVLDPIMAFERRLVKQIWVSEVTGGTGGNEALVAIERVDKKKTTVTVRIHRKTNDGVSEVPVVLRKGDDLYVESNELPAYKDRFVVIDLSVNPDDTYIKFQNGQQVTTDSQIGGAREDIWRLQIEKTVEHHFEKVKENQEKKLNVKVLSLFFIDKVANYRIDPENAEDQGKFADAFEAAFKRFASDVRFKDLELSERPAATVHAGYFSKDKKVFKDSKEGRETAADDQTYNLIMKDKERLLSPEEPVQFIFSHSALREGWDNPNVFQICTLNESKSSMKKRQEIGRGLRIPVDHTGKRVFNEQLNRLVVVANENYEEFARKLQTEYEDDAAVVFGRVTISDLVSVIKNGDGGDEKISSDKAKEVALRIQVALRDAGVLDADDKIASGFDPEKAHDQIELPEGFEELKPAVIDLVITGQISRHVKKEAKRNTNRLKIDLIKSPEFQALWEKIRPRTTYALDFDSDKFVTEIAGQIRATVFDIKAPRVNTRTARVIANAAGVTATAVSATEHEVDLSKRPVQDVLAYLQDGTDLTRATLLKILNQSGTLGLLFLNPQAYLDRVIETISVGLGKKLTAGINYQRIIGADSEALWQMAIFPDELPVDTASSLVIKVKKSVYDYIPCDSIIEYKFAKGLDGRDDILLFVKLPRDFKIDTPVGRYNPDWGIVKKTGEMLVLVRETKATRNLDRLRFPNEATKLLCGDKHFAVIGVDYTWLKVHEDV